MRVHLVVQVLCQSDSFMLSMPALHVYTLYTWLWVGGKSKRRASVSPNGTQFASLEGRRQEGHDVDPDERTARVKGNERPLPPPLLLHPAWHLTDVV